MDTGHTYSRIACITRYTRRRIQRRCVVVIERRCVVLLETERVSLDTKLYDTKLLNTKF